MSRSIARFTAALVAAVLFVIIWSLYTTGAVQVSWQRFSYTNVLYALLVFPVCEELIFRGVLQQELWRWFERHSISYGSLWANGVSSCVFALAHAVYFSNGAALLVFFPSLVFGYFYATDRSLVTPIALHSSYNAIALATIAVF